MNTMKNRLKNMNVRAWYSLKWFLLAAFLSLIGSAAPASADSWKTDKWDTKASIEAGGWEVVYFEEVDSMDVLEAGVLTYIGGPTGFKAWFAAWTADALARFESDARTTFGDAAQEAAEEFMEGMIEDLAQGRVPGTSMRTFGAIQMKGGIAEYHGCNTIYNPFSGDRVCAHPEVPSWQPYVAIRVKPGALPDSNEFQGWRICNKSSDPKVWVAYAYHDGSEWVRAGWRGIDQGACSQILDRLNTRYVYYYGESSTGTWSGDVELCTHPTSKFQIGDNQTCSSPYELAAFIRVDTGDSTRWTTNMID